MIDANYNFFGMDPVLLNKQQEAMERVKKIVIHHPTFNDIFREIFQCHKLSSGSQKPGCMCIFGDSGSGKSTVLEYYRDKFPRRQEANEKGEWDVIPVLLVELPSGATPKDVASKILFAMGDPFFDSGTERTMKGRILYLLEETGVELLVLDEFQHINKSESKRVQSQVADWIKGLVNEIKIPVILSGMPSAESLFLTNEQLDTRFSNRKRLRPFVYDKNFRAFLKAVDEDLPFTQSSQLADPELSQKLYYASLGNLRVLMGTLEWATCEAVAASRDYINEDDLYVAFIRVDLSSRPHVVNPFNDEKFNFKVAFIEEGKKKKKA